MRGRGDTITTYTVKLGTRDPATQTTHVDAVNSRYAYNYSPVNQTEPSWHMMKIHRWIYVVFPLVR